VADKSSFTKEEWVLLLESPMMAGLHTAALIVMVRRRLPPTSPQELTKL